MNSFKPEQKLSEATTAFSSFMLTLLLCAFTLGLPVWAYADSNFTVTVSASVSPTTIYTIGTTSATGSATATITGNNPGAVQELQQYNPSPAFSIVSVTGKISGDTPPTASINSNGSNLTVTAGSKTTGDTYTVTVKADYAWKEGTTQYDESGTATVTVTVVAISASFASQPPTRIPISGTIINQYKINVTVSPSPLPAGVGPISVSAVGASGSAYVSPTSLSSSGTVTLAGIANSSTANGLVLQIAVGSQVLATSSPFTVSTHPTGLTLTEYSTDDYFGITVALNWTSESGNVGDLGNFLMTETFPSISRPNPPFTTETAKTMGYVAIQQDQIDQHDYRSSSVNYQQGSATYTLNQNYVWYDTVLGSSSTSTIIFSDVISRTVSPITITDYYFKTAISGGFTDSCTEIGP